MIHSPLSLPGYRINEQLYQGTRTIVYQGERRQDGQPVVIKLLRSEYPNFNELVQFRNQYTIAKNLDIPGIVKPYSLEPYRNGYALVMEDFGGISLADSIKTRVSFPIINFLTIALQLANILEELHRERVIHKDIKPANILIHPETGQVKLIDFSISSLLPTETQQIQSPNVLEGTLAYISPEQTGRMNRGIDYRTDFYSLGVTFYQLLSGQLPFTSDEPMELVHSHIAKIPPSVYDLNPETPPILSNLVGKLMAKNAEDRYQSALGLKVDLEQCLSQWKETGKIEQFELGRWDWCDRFLIPEKLYGRESEVAQLLEAFERVSGGAGEQGSRGERETEEMGRNSELVLVAGYSGVGKTAVVNEVHKPIVHQRGYFIKGKFDQFNRNIPLSAFVQAFRDLMGQLLSESDAQLSRWKNKILHALGENGQVIIDVIPELERIIGQQPPVPELSGSAAQSRFNLLFQKFVGIFATQDHPLVIFLDDLQWSDLASLKLMQLLMSEADRGYLLLIGAYRDNEVSPTHPLMLAVEELQKANAAIDTITLAPLHLFDLNCLVAETLSCSPQLAQPLTELLYQKTRGNPFFATQFLKSLHSDGLIVRSDREEYRGVWLCDMTRVKQLALTEDVVEFMAQQLQKLPPKTQEILKLAACIGNQFDLETLAIVSEQSQSEAATNLWKALQEEFVLPISDVYKFFQGNSELQHQNEEEDKHSDRACFYKFLHDRIQQAAYSLIAEPQKKITHYRIGKRLLAQLSPIERDEKIFDIVNQINIGRSEIADETENKQLIELNFNAGQKAKLSTAYDAAKTYFKMSINLLSKDAWMTDYNLAFQLHFVLAEVQLMSVDFEPLEETVSTLLEFSNSSLDRAKTHVLKVNQYSLQGAYPEAIKSGLTGLQELGTTVNQETLDKLLQEDSLAIERKLENCAINSLLDLPEATDPAVKVEIDLLMNLLSAAYINSNINLYGFTIVRNLRLSMEHGNIPKSITAYVNYGEWLGLMQNQYQRGVEFAELALQLSYQLNSKSQQSSACFLFGGCIYVKAKPIQGAAEINYEGFLAGMESGELQYAGYNLFANIYNRLFQGENLSTIATDLDKYWAIAEKIHNDLALSVLEACRFFINKLSCSPDEQDTTCVLREERAWIERHQAAQSYLPLGIYNILKMHEACLSQNFSQGIDYEVEARKFLTACSSCTISIGYYYYGSLNLFGSYLRLSGLERKDALQQMENNQRHLKILSESCPENFQHKYLLVEAERARIKGQRLDAIELYDRAIAGAKANEYLQEEALANELAAKFYLDWGKEKVASGYMQEAYYCYARWGAKAKTDDLEQRYPQLLSPILQPEKIRPDISSTLTATETFHSTSSSTSSILDLTTVIKASQALSSEIHLEQLVAKLMEVVIENAGADKGVLILNERGKWNIVAQYLDGVASNLEGNPLEQSLTLPLNIINYVKRTSSRLLTQDVLGNSSLLSDRYFQENSPKSLLCTPILNQGQFIGILYLENYLTAEAFTRDRIEILNLLCSQAAISLENARLYDLEQQRAKELAQKEEEYRSIFESVNDGLSICDLATGRIIAVNPTFCELYGYSQEEWLHLTPLDFMHPDYLHCFNNFLDTLNAGKEFYTQCLCKRKDGRFFDVEVKAVPFMYQGKVHGLSIVRDISDRKRAEEALLESEAYHRNLFEQSSIGLSLCRMDGSTVYANAAFARIVGRTPEEVLSLTYWQLTPENYADAEQQQLHSLRTTGCYGPYEKEYIHKNGSLVPVRLSGVIVERHGEQFIWSGVEDISDRKQAEQQLLDTKNLYQQILDAIPDLILCKAAQSSIVYANKAFRDYYNMSLENLQEIIDAPFNNPDYTQQYVKDDAYVFNTGETLVLEEPVTRHDGEIRIFSTIKSAVFDTEGSVIQTVGISRDISDRKAAEATILQKSQELECALQELQNAQLQLVQSEKMSALGNLVAGVAHEINNPVGFISGNLNEAIATSEEILNHLKLYQNTFPDPGVEIEEEAEDIDLDYIVEDLPKMLNSMKVGCDRIKTICTSLRTFSRADSTAKIAANLHEGLDSTLMILRYRLKAKDTRPEIQVIKEYGNIPQVQCHFGQLNQVFMNIIANAIDAFEEANGDRTYKEIQANPNIITIATAASEDKQTVMVKIKDNGKGMPQEVQARIFDRLFTTKGIGKGTGLGLSISRQIVEEMHGGSLRCTSVIGQGTEFAIALPL